jgi:hypothetical protein
LAPDSGGSSRFVLDFRPKSSVLYLRLATLPEFSFFPVFVVYGSVMFELADSRGIQSPDQPKASGAAPGFFAQNIAALCSWGLAGLFETGLAPTARLSVSD